MSEQRPNPKLDYESLLRQASSCSFSIGNGWSIGMNDGDSWQVFYSGFDASFRIAVASDAKKKDAKVFKTFAAAWKWAQSLTDEQVRLITVVSMGSGK